MNWFEENKELLLFGAELEAIGETENASSVYLTYVKEAAKLSEYEDVLEMLYGRSVYNKGITTSYEALDYATIALSAKSLIILARNKFALPGSFNTSVSENNQNIPVLRFFEWLSKKHGVSIRDYEILKRVKRELEETDVISVVAPHFVSRCGFMEIVADIVSGNIRVTSKGLQ